MHRILIAIHSTVWGIPGLVLILGVGIYLTWITGFSQLTLFPRAIRKFFGMLRGGGKQEGVSQFQALCTALAATVGTGNLIGVAGAICLGGPGAIFWMWICGIIGMATKFSEAALAVHYRVRRGSEYVGGPMYTISRGMGEKWKPLAVAYCVFGLLASLGVGNAAQVNAVITGVNSVATRFGGQESQKGNLLIGVLLAMMVGMTLLGGAARIGRAAEKLIPFASAGYILLCAFLLICRAEAIPAAFLSIFQGAFSPKAVTGGILGSSFRALSVGCSRGVFTNEAGMGTASIAHASAQVDSPGEQGLMGIIEVFLDTIVICTMTALAILASGVAIPYGRDEGGKLTTAAFSSVYGDWVSVALAAFLCCFAFATILGWGLYGARCGEFLFGTRAFRWISLIQTAAILLASVMKTETVWLLSETVNGLMAIPNLISLAVLSPELGGIVKSYKERHP